MGLGDEKYILLTTTKRDGTQVETPVWVAALDDGSLGFWTSSGSGKAKRLAHTPTVTVQPCDARGRVKDGTSPTNASAALVSGDEMDEIRWKITEKYGFQTKITKVLGQVGGMIKRNSIPYGDQGVVITLNA